MSKHTSQNTLKKNASLLALLGCTALALPLQAEAAISAKTSWAVSRVASASQGSYCTMAQKYADDTVLTLAQNTKGEYSLALDFKNGQFKAGQKQSIALSVDGGKAKSYDVMPQNANTAVIGIGKDAELIKKISASEKISVKINSDSSDFELSEFQTGQKELDVCMEALQKPAEKQAKDVDTASAKSKMNDVVTASGNNEPSVEGLLAAAPKSSSEITVQADDDFTPVIPAKPKEGGKVEKADNSHLEIASLREENARLSRALSEQRRSFEAKQAGMDGAAVTEMREKLEAARVENESLRGELAQMSAKGSQSAAAATAATAANAAAATKDAAQLAKLNDTVKALQQENQTLKNQIEIYVSSKGKSDANADVLAKLQAENADLKQVVSSLKAQNSEASATVAATTSLDAEMNKLRNENRKISSELELARTENADLQKRATSLQKDMEGKQLKMAGGSWDLEQATRRYQESQREIVRLGSLLQAKDVKCANEKKDIEYMLFDPAIATKAQISMLNSMEDQIKERDEKLRTAEDALENAKVASKESPEKDARIAELEKSVSDAKAQLASQTQQLADAQNKIGQAEAVKANSEAQGKDLAALKAELDHKTKALADAEAKMQTSQVAKADIEGKNKILLDMQNTIATKSQQLAEAQAKLQQASNAQLASTTQKDTEVQTLKAQLSQTQALLQAEQVKVEQANLQQANISAQTQQGAQQSAQQAALIANLQLQVQQANQKVIQLQNQISETNSAALRAASIAPAAAAVAPVPAYQPAANPVSNASYSAPVAQAPAAKFKSMSEFSSMLKNAGVNVRGELQQVKGGDPSSYRAYSWKTDSLYGSAEMKKVSDASQFDAGVNQYLSRAKSRCEGEFAAVPSPVKATSMEQSKAYEIACVSQGSSSSASVLFTYGHQIATTIAHEGRAEAMDLAIDARDKVSSNIN